MPTKRPLSGPDAYQIKITLKGSKPPIWRRFLVPGNITLAKLHDVIQIVMGWYDSHLHAFEVNGEQYAQLARDEVPLDIDGYDERKFRLAGDDVYDDDHATFYAEEGMNEEALAHWDRPSARPGPRRGRWWSRPVARDFETERELDVIEISELLRAEAKRNAASRRRRKKARAD